MLMTDWIQYLLTLLLNHRGLTATACWSHVIDGASCKHQTERVRACVRRWAVISQQ